jgi:ERCC4-type nuclease
MKILVDNREKVELEFVHPYITAIEHTTLSVGDYGCCYIDNHIPPVFFERKSIPDLFGTLSKGYKRFKKEILRSKEQQVLLVIIIEGSLTKILKGYERSKRGGDEITKQLFTLMVRHHIPFICCSNREEMARYITEVYLAIGRNRFEGKEAK